MQQYYYVLTVTDGNGQQLRIGDVVEAEKGDMRTALDKALRAGTWKLINRSDAVCGGPYTIDKVELSRVTS